MKNKKVCLMQFLLLPPPHSVLVDVSCSTQAETWAKIGSFARKVFNSAKIHFRECNKVDPSESLAMMFSPCFSTSNEIISISPKSAFRIRGQKKNIVNPSSPLQKKLGNVPLLTGESDNQQGIPGTIDRMYIV
jgi:hypothetical protein